MADVVDFAIETQVADWIWGSRLSQGCQD